MSINNIDDEMLIKWFKDNSNTFSYLSFNQTTDNYNRIENLKSSIKELNPKKTLNLQKDLILNIWKNLIGNAIVFLKFKDDREIFHDDEDYGVDKLDEFFQIFLKSETLFYGSNEYYRDHVLHMFRVYLLGHFLLSKNDYFEKINHGEGNMSTPIEISVDEKEAMWCIIALTHDLGYIFEIINDINKKSKNMLEQFSNQPLQELHCTLSYQAFYQSMLEFISSKLIEIPEKFSINEDKPSYINHVQSKYFTKFSKSFEESSHGIMSCLVLMKNLVFFLESDFSKDIFKPLSSDDAKQYLIRKNILKPIASHDCDDIYYLKVADFSFLLTIFDEMQEWGRPRLMDLFEVSPVTSLNVRLLSEECVKYEIVFEIPGNIDHINNKDREEMKKACLQYFIRKSGRIRRILRSAVDGNKRKLTVDFTVIDKIGKKDQYHFYQIIHKTPEDVRINYDNKEILWYELLDKK